uniref:BAR domain-containing protein n=1 Tax=Felis catus TaxID=9685 RepID=A0ABI8AJJ3_FELCA
MDFNMKKLASDAGIFFTRAVQFTEEKFGQAEKTELDAHFENLLARADSTKNWTEKILRQTEVLLQPNPSARVEEFLYEKLDRKVPSRVTNGELLAQYMAEAASELGPTTPYGKTLIKVAEAEKRLGAAERDFIHTASINFLTPLRNFLEGDWKTISKERRLLQNRRLDLDACKARLKKAKAAEAKATTVPDFQETRPRNYILSASASAVSAPPRPPGLPAPAPPRHGAATQHSSRSTGHVLRAGRTGGPQPCLGPPACPPAPTVLASLPCAPCWRWRPGQPHRTAQGAAGQRTRPPHLHPRGPEFCPSPPCSTTPGRPAMGSQTRDWRRGWCCSASLTQCRGGEERPRERAGRVGAPRERAGGPRIEGRRWAGWGREGFRCRGISSSPLRPATRCLPVVWSMGHPRPSHRTCGHHRWLCLFCLFLPPSISALGGTPWHRPAGSPSPLSLHVAASVCALTRWLGHRSPGAGAPVHSTRPLLLGALYTHAWGPLPTFWFPQWHCGGTPRSAELTLSCFQVIILG